MFDLKSDIPIISEESSASDLLVYIRILEARLEIHLVPDAGLLSATGMLADGAVRYVPASQAERVRKLQSGMDAVSLREAEIAALRELVNS